MTKECVFSKPCVEDEGHGLYFVLESEGDFRECYIEWNEECQLFEIRSNDNLVAMIGM